MKTLAVLGTTVAGGVGGMWTGTIVGMTWGKNDWSGLTGAFIGIVAGALTGVAIGVHFFT